MKLLWFFVGWTLFLWITRLRNVFGDDELSSGERIIATLIALAFLGVAVSVPILARRANRWFPRVMRFLATVTIAWWSVRLVTNLVSDESAGFKAVHTVLALVSIVLAIAVLSRRVLVDDAVRMAPSSRGASTI